MSYAVGVDSADGILTTDTKFHSLHIDVYFIVSVVSADGSFIVLSIASTFDDSVVTTLLTKW